MQAGEHHRLGAAAHGRHRPRQDAGAAGQGYRLRRIGVAAIDPENARLAQFIRRQRIGGAGVTPAHIPEILGEHRPKTFLFRLFAEHRLVEIAEFVALLEEDRQIHVRRQLDRAVIAGFDPAITRQHVGDQILRPFGVGHAEADRQHEFLGIVGELQRAQHLEAGFGLLGEIDPGNEELHVLPDVGRQRPRRIGRNPVAALLQPGFEAIGLRRRENHDVVFAHGIAGLDRHPQCLR